MLELQRIVWHNWKKTEKTEMIVIGNIFDAMLMLKDKIKERGLNLSNVMFNKHADSYECREHSEGFNIDLNDDEFVIVSRAYGFWNIYGGEEK